MQPQIEILWDLTTKHFDLLPDHYEPYGLPKSLPHAKLYVQCTRCKEIFIREAQNLSRPHACQCHIDHIDRSGLGIVEPVRLEYRIICPDGRAPTRSRYTDVGYDLYSAEYCIVPGCCAAPMIEGDSLDSILVGTAKIHTGIQVSVPAGFWYSIEGRSGMGMKGIIPFCGVIDSTYTGEILVLLINLTDKPYDVKNGDRIAQMVIHKTVEVDFTKVDVFSKNYDMRGEAGFGASGR